jgi:hypothetical protein
MAVRVIRASQLEQLLPSIKVEPSFQDIAKTADPAKIAEQLRHAHARLELTRQYPGRERSFQRERSFKKDNG